MRDSWINEYNNKLWQVEVDLGSYRFVRYHVLAISSIAAERKIRNKQIYVMHIEIHGLEVSKLDDIVEVEY